MKNHKICYGYEKIKGKTLRGGDYSEIYYYDNENIMCEAREATHCIIYERKKNGAVVHTIYGTL